MPRSLSCLNSDWRKLKSCQVVVTRRNLEYRTKIKCRTSRLAPTSQACEDPTTWRQCRSAATPPTTRLTEVLSPTSSSRLTAKIETTATSSVQTSLTTATTRTAGPEQPEQSLWTSQAPPRSLQTAGNKIRRKSLPSETRSRTSGLRQLIR